MRLRLSLLMFLQYAAPGAMLPLYSRYLDRLGFSPMETAFCCSTQAVATVLAALVAGHVADRWVAAERCLAVCAVLAGLDLWVLAGLTSPAGVFTATLLYWLLTGPILMLGATVCFTHLPRPERQFGSVRLWGTVGWMMSGWLLGYWFADPAWLCRWVGQLRPEAPHSQPADIFRLGSVLALVLGAYVLTLPGTPPQRAPARGPSAPRQALRLLSSGRFAVYCICTLGVCATLPFATQGTPLLLSDLGISRAGVAWTLTLAQVSEILSLALLPMLLLRLGLRGTMMLGLGAWTAALTVLAVGRPVGLVVGSLAFNGLCISGFLVAGQVFVNSRARGGVRASVQALLTFINGLGMLAGNLLVGWLRARAGGSLPPAFAVGAAITFCLLVVFAAGFREEADTGPQTQISPLPSGKRGAEEAPPSADSAVTPPAAGTRRS